MGPRRDNHFMEAARSPPRSKAMVVKCVENCSRVEVISTITESQHNLGRQTYRQTDIQYTETAGPTDRRSEKDYI